MTFFGRNWFLSANDVYMAGLQMEVMLGVIHGNVLQSFDRFVDPAVVHEEGHLRRRTLQKMLQSGANYLGKFTM